jgi:ABC-2 type transport system ATP-binding protein
VAAAIVTKGLTKKYGDRVVVDHLDLKINEGEVFGLLGPNGAGKTTTILMCLGLSEPTSGTATVVGFDPARQPIEVKQVVGYLPDAVGFYEGMTGRENLRYTARLNALEKDEGENRIESLLTEVGLAVAADRQVGTYSRGMRQRLGIADALVKDPKILILDEPTVSIDPEGVAEILALIRRLADERGVTLLLSSHLLHQVQSVCDRVGIFVEGRLVAQGRVAELARGAEGGAGWIELETDADPTRVTEALAAVPGLADVEQVHSGHWRLRGPLDVTPRVVAALVGAGIPVRRVEPVEPDLDEVYRRVYHGGEVADGDGH